MRNRSQVFNPVTQTWTKRDGERGQFMDQKKDGDPFKGVRKERVESLHHQTASALIVARTINDLSFAGPTMYRGVRGGLVARDPLEPGEEGLDVDMEMPFAWG